MNILDLIGIIILFLFVIVGTIIFIASDIMTKKVKKEFSKFRGDNENKS
tara:strand:+ start:462 stop:608 length:147 start_codon:yes stop_codon:yes gene_type:complete